MQLSGCVDVANSSLQVQWQLRRPRWFTIAKKGHGLRCGASEKGSNVMRRFRIWVLWSLAFSVALPLTLCAEPVPNFVGRHLSAVKAEAETKAIVLEIERVDSPEHRGEILLQIPGGGSEIGTNRRVFLRVSNGLIVPDSRGLSEKEAQAALTAAGIGSMSTQHAHPCVSKGIVADQVPEAGTRINAYSKIVFLDVSNDPRIKVPTITAEDVSHMHEIFEELCLTGNTDIEIVTIQDCMYIPQPFGRPYVEIQLDPDPGTWVAPYTTISVKIKKMEYKCELDECERRCYNQYIDFDRIMSCLHQCRVL